MQYILQYRCQLERGRTHHQEYYAYFGASSGLFDLCLIIPNADSEKTSPEQKLWDNTQLKKKHMFLKIFSAQKVCKSIPLFDIAG